MNLASRRSSLWRHGLGALLALGLISGLNMVSLHVQPEGAKEARFVASGLERLEKGDIRAVNIGGSVGKSLLFAELGIPGVDFSYYDRDLFENEALLDVLLKRAHGLQTVFLVASPMSLLMDNSWSKAPVRRQYYRILAPDRGWQPIGGDWANLILGRLLPLAREDRWRGPLKAMFGSRAEAAPHGQAWAPNGRPVEATDEPALLTKAGLHAELSKIGAALYFEHDTPERSAAALVEICRTVTTHGLELVIYTTPTDSLYTRIAAPYIAKAQPYWDKAVHQCTTRGARVLRLDEDPAFQQADHLFKDPAHLNKAGSALFSKKLSQRLGHGLIQTPNP